MPLPCLFFSALKCYFQALKLEELDLSLRYIYSCSKVGSCTFKNFVEFSTLLDMFSDSSVIFP